MDHRFTCISCRVAFIDSETQRNHYKTDWHRYNLKRKVSQLPPLTAEQFTQRVIQQRANAEKEARNESVYCKICKKTFGTEKAYENHLNSKKHKAGLTEGDEDISEPTREKPEKKEEEVSSEDDSDIEEVDSDEWDDDELNENNPILRNDCLFCTHHSSTMTKNLKHMTVEHSFHVPDFEFVVDLRGLLLHLGEKVATYYMCLWCSTAGKAFHGLEATQQHMRDKGHCKMLHEGASLIEYYPYYNYTKSYPEAEEMDLDDDEEVVIPELNGEDYELTLPSGAKVGHRSLLRYYKQYFNPNREVVTKQPKVRNLLKNYKALGWTESDKSAVMRRARDVHFLQRVQSKYYAKLGVKANKLQKHFRPQVNF